MKMKWTTGILIALSSLIAGCIAIMQCQTSVFKDDQSLIRDTRYYLEQINHAQPLTALEVQPIEISAAGTTVRLTADRLLTMQHDAGPVFKIGAFATWNKVTQIVRQEHAVQLQIEEKMTSTITIDPAGDLLVTIAFEGETPEVFKEIFIYPGILLSDSGQSWVLPENEGLLIPVADSAYSAPWPKAFYMGHAGLSMPFLGLTDGNAGILVIAETPDDGGMQYVRPGVLGRAKPSAWIIGWQPQKGMWSYERRLRIKFIADGGYVGIAKAYRQYAKNHGLLVTLREKARSVPAVDRLIGAADIWWWADAQSWMRDMSPQNMAKTLKDAGFDRVLWSNMASPEAVAFMNGLGFVTSRYDIYQDVWSPTAALTWMNTRGWPDSLVLWPDGSWKKGWVHKEGGRKIPGGIICALKGLEYLKHDVDIDLQTNPYTARFIDTVTASPLHECYNPKHPLTRSEDKLYKAKMLSYLSVEKKLVTGSETGLDWAIPYLHYFEGMMSIANFRLPDSGYDLVTYMKPQEDFFRFETGPYYRIPLFQLVYHDCVVTSWYWGDSSNRIPEVWDDRDLYNLLYGTIPLYIMDRNIWIKYRPRFIQSYQTATKTARKTGYDEMLTHQFLTNDHTVQNTKFADGTQVWVNFGRMPYTLDNGVIVPAKGSHYVPGPEEIRQ